MRKSESTKNSNGTITDHATGLMWQKSGSYQWLKYQDVASYISKINRNRFAGHSDWCLPTVPELISLLTSKKQSNGFYIDPVFDKKQNECWSSDKRSSDSGWFVFFNLGGVSWLSLYNLSYYVRAVRSGQ